MRSFAECRRATRSTWRRDGIRAVLERRVPEEILTPHPRHALDRWQERLAGCAVRSVDAHGKHLFLRFDGGLTLHSHLRMSGSWGVFRQGEPWRRSPRRAWLVIRCEGWEVVEFDGPVLELLSDRRIASDPRLARLGQDVLGERFDEALFLGGLRAGDRSRAVGEALLDQRTVAGIGNVWKAESCFAAGIDPWRAVGAISDAEALALVAFARGRCGLRRGRGRPRGRDRSTGAPGAPARGVRRRSGRGARARTIASPSGARAASAEVPQMSAASRVPAAVSALSPRARRTACRSSIRASKAPSSPRAQTA